jgi:hypothetical protein
MERMLMTVNLAKLLLGYSLDNYLKVFVAKLLTTSPFCAKFPHCLAQFNKRKLKNIPQPLSKVSFKVTLVIYAPLTDLPFHGRLNSCK